MTHLGTILTSAPDEPWLRERAASFPVLKIVTAWGLPWNDDLRRVVATLCPILVVRTVAGDPSYVDEVGRPRSPLPDTNDSARELDPWYAAFRAVADPGDRLWFEIGNEPLIGKPNSPATLSANDVWAYADILAQTLRTLAARYPLASFILPAQMLNHHVSVEGVPYAQPWMVELIAKALQKHGVLDALRGRLAVGLHAYTEQQYTEGRALADKHFPGLPVWLTEFALNQQMPAAERGRKYAELLSKWDVEAVLLYHLDAFGGTDPTHFNANYRLTLDTLRAVRVPPPLERPSMAPSLATLGIIDVRHKLNVIQSRRKAIERRTGKATGITLHYNGPAVKAFGNPDAELLHIMTTDVKTHQTNPRVMGDSLQYHLCVLSDGSIYQTRDLDLPASHAAVTVPNRQHLAIHLPLGGLQDATPIQWERTTQLMNALIAHYGMAGRAVVKGHQEWSATECPGPRLQPRLEAWRKGDVPTGGLYRIRADVAAALVREGPARTFPVALGGKAKMYPGDVLDADAVTQGEAVSGDVRWLHRRDGLGFVHMSLVEGL